MSSNSPEATFFFVLFIVHCTTVFFIAGVYAFAYRFLANRFYIPLALGWLANAFYIGVETIFFVERIGDDHNRLSLNLLTAGLGIVSMPFFHFAIAKRSHKAKSLGYTPYLIAPLLMSICFGSAAWFGTNTGSSANWIFAASTFPAALYSALVLFSVSHRFFLSFPESDYGLSSKVLYSSWAGYGIIQFFYPFKMFLFAQPLLFVILFLFSFCIKVLSSVALLNVLRESYLVAQAEVREASVLADIGNVAAGLHHDIANPLTWIDNELAILAQKRAEDNIVMASIKKIRKPVKLIDSAIQFVSFIRVDPSAIARNFRRVNAKEPVELAISLYKKKHPNAAMRVLLPRDTPTYFVRANPNLLAEAFLNVINNALEASAHRTRVRIRRIFNPEPLVEFSFVNNGKLLSEEELNNCFKPGWSSKQRDGVNANTGLGLYMATKIISIHRGSIDIDNELSAGEVKVRICLPAAKHQGDKDNLEVSENDDGSAGPSQKR